MCKDARQVALNYMDAIEPKLKQAFVIWNVPVTDQTTVINEFDLAKSALQNWTQGTSAQTVSQLLTVFDSGFDALPFIPQTDKTLADVIDGMVQAILGVLEVNEQPTPNIIHAAVVAHRTTLAIKQRVPELKKVNLHDAEDGLKQANEIWDARVKELHPDYVPAA